MNKFIKEIRIASSRFELSEAKVRRILNEKLKGPVRKVIGDISSDSVDNILSRLEKKFGEKKKSSTSNFAPDVLEYVNISTTIKRLKPQAVNATQKSTNFEYGINGRTFDIEKPMILKKCKLSSEDVIIRKEKSADLKHVLGAAKISSQSERVSNHKSTTTEKLGKTKGPSSNEKSADVKHVIDRTKLSSQSGKITIQRTKLVLNHDGPQMPSHVGRIAKPISNKVNHVRELTKNKAQEQQKQKHSQNIQTIPLKFISKDEKLLKIDEKSKEWYKNYNRLNHSDNKFLNEFNKFNKVTENLTSIYLNFGSKLDKK